MVRMDTALSDFMSRAITVKVPDGMPAELVGSAKKLRKKYNLPINGIERAEPFELIVPFDPKADSDQTAKIVNAHDFDEPIRFTYRVPAGSGAYEFSITAKVRDFQVRDQKSWKQPRLIVSLEPVRVEEFDATEFIESLGGD